MDEPKRGRGGARPGSGRKPDAVRMELKNLLAECVGLAARREILKRAVEQAQAGSIKHQELVLGYLYGKPTQRLEHAGDPTAPIRVVYVNDWRGGEDDAADA